MSSIFCFVSKADRVKIDWDRKLRPSFALSPVLKIRGGISRRVWVRKSCSLVYICPAAAEIRAPVKHKRTRAKHNTFRQSAGGLTIPNLIMTLTVLTLGLCYWRVLRLSTGSRAGVRGKVKHRPFCDNTQIVYH